MCWCWARALSGLHSPLNWWRHSWGLRSSRRRSDSFAGSTRCCRLRRASVRRAPESKAARVSEIKAIYCDVGGVLLTNGWDHHSRKRLVEAFGLDLAEFEK